MIGLWGVGGAVGTTVGGTLADRWGRRPTLLTAHLGAATMMLGLGLARPLWTVALGALLLGMFAEAARPEAAVGITVGLSAATSAAAPLITRQRTRAGARACPPVRRGCPR